jgi:hypothetical protein
MDFENRCLNCAFRDRCELVDNTSFCEDCEQYDICTVRNVYCEAGHEVECNNDFTPKGGFEDEENE